MCAVGDLIITCLSPQRQLVFQTAEVLILVFFEFCLLSFVYSFVYHFSITNLDAGIPKIHVCLLFVPHKLKNGQS